MRRLRRLTTLDKAVGLLHGLLEPPEVALDRSGPVLADFGPHDAQEISRGAPDSLEQIEARGGGGGRIRRKRRACGGCRRCEPDTSPQGPNDALQVAKVASDQVTLRLDEQ